MDASLLPSWQMNSVLFRLWSNSGPSKPFLKGMGNLPSPWTGGEMAGRYHRAIALILEGFSTLCRGGYPDDGYPSAPLSAQEKGRAPPKNPKVLTPEHHMERMRTDAAGRWAPS